MCVYVCTYVCRCVHIDNSSIVQFLYNVSLIEEKGWRERCFFFKSGISLPHTYHTHTTPHACACLNGMRSRAKRFTSLYRVLSRTAPSLRKQKTTTKETKTWLWRARRRNHPPAGLWSAFPFDAYPVYIVLLHIAQFFFHQHGLYVASVTQCYAAFFLFRLSVT